MVVWLDGVCLLYSVKQEKQAAPGIKSKTKNRSKTTEAENRL